jgi:hypothetical protein
MTSKPGTEARRLIRPTEANLMRAEDTGDGEVRGRHGFEARSADVIAGQDNNVGDIMRELDGNTSGTRCP